MNYLLDIFNLVFLQPIINLLVLIVHGLNSLHLPGVLGFSIMFMTIFVRLLVWPFMASQLKSAKKLAEIKPHMDQLKKKHAADKQALAAAQMALYKEHGVNPAGGCLPALVQIPVFIALYQSINNILPGGNIAHINSLVYFPWMKLPGALDPNFFGINLGFKPSQFGEHGIYLLAIPLLTAALTYVQSQMTIAKAAVSPYPTDSAKEKQEKEGMEESMAQVQNQMVYFMPLMIGYFAFTFPAGLAIYWNTYTILGIVQQYLISGWGGFGDTLNKLTRHSPEKGNPK